MKIRDIMTSPAISISPNESVEVAARTLTHYNVGALPVCGSDGKICGLVTDRDLVTRCMASNRAPGQTTVRDVMTGQVMSVQPDMEIDAAARLMGKQQIRRLPVTQNGKLCGMVSLGDIATKQENLADTAGVLADVSSNISHR